MDVADAHQQTLAMVSLCVMCGVHSKAIVQKNARLAVGEEESFKVVR
jgi:hypothetical protein